MNPHVGGLEKLIAYCKPHAIQEVVAMGLDDDLDASPSKARENSTHLRLSIGVKVRFRAVDQQNLIIRCGK